MPGPVRSGATGVGLKARLFLEPVELRARSDRRRETGAVWFWHRHDRCVRRDFRGVRPPECRMDSRVGLHYGVDYMLVQGRGGGSHLRPVRVNSTAVFHIVTGRD